LERAGIFHILKGVEIKERRLTQGRKHQNTLYLLLFSALSTSFSLWLFFHTF